MKFRIGAHKNPAIVDMHPIQVCDGIWATIEAPDANIAAAVFLSSNVEGLYEMREWRLYELTEDWKIREFDYCLEDTDLADPPPIIRTY